MLVKYCQDLVFVLEFGGVCLSRPVSHRDTLWIHRAERPRGVLLPEMGFLHNLNCPANFVS